MNKIRFILGIAALVALLSCKKTDADPRLVIITFDGLRWQELFSGADGALVGDARFVEDTAALREAFWRPSPEERREALLPFLWSYVPEHGYFIGNRNKGSRMRVANVRNYSYPGYSEMFCGWADDERIHSNDPVVNPNRNVLEAANEDPRYKGRVMMYSSWESIRYAVANERAGIPGSSAHESSYTDSPMARALQQMDGALSGGFGGEERADAITYGMALETLLQDHPKVFYVGFGDTDEYAHGGRYDCYLNAIHWTDGFIRGIVEACEADPFYKGRTTYLLTCDHGRGRKAGFTGHGGGTRGSEETWFIAFGAGVPALGETTGNGTFYTQQFAATIADILGIDFTPDNGEKSLPIDPAYFLEEATPETAAAGAPILPSVQAVPAGPGLRYTYSEGDFKSVVPVLTAPVKARGIVPEPTTEVKLREDHFGLVFKGLLKVPADGVYCLGLTSDDGSRLWVDGVLAADIDRNGGGFADAWLHLQEGFHRIEVQYFENYAGDEVILGLPEGCTLHYE